MRQVRRHANFRFNDMRCPLMEEAEWLSETEQRMWTGYLVSTRFLLRALERQL